MGWGGGGRVKKWRVRCEPCDWDWRWWGLGLAVFFRRAGGFSVDLHLGPLWVEVRVGRRET